MAILEGRMVSKLSNRTPGKRKHRKTRNLNAKGNIDIYSAQDRGLVFLKIGTENPAVQWVISSMFCLIHSQQILQDWQLRSLDV